MPSAIRAATVIEKSPSIQTPPPSQPLAPARVDPVQRTSTTPARGIPKAAWLGVGGLAIAGAITFAIFSGNPKPQHSKVEEPVTQPAPAPTGGSGGDTGRLFPEDKPKQSRKVPVAPDDHGGVTGGNGLSTPTPPHPSPGNPDPLADRSYAQALDLQRKQGPCDAMPAMSDAVRRDPTNQKYLAAQTQMKRSCDSVQGADTYYNSAKQKFDQGDYCEGKSSIDEAVRRAPSNPSYLSLQQRLAKGCAAQ